MNDAMFFTLQVIIGVLVIVAVYRMSLWILREDQLVIDERRRKNHKAAVKIVDGYAMSSLAANRVWNTMNPSGIGYVDLPRSLNRKGGAQFTYQFWLYLDDTTPGNVANRDILIRGDSRRYNFKRTVTRTRDAAMGGGDMRDVQDFNNVFIKAPRIRFGRTFDELVIEFNTLHNPDEKIVVEPRAAGGNDPTMRRNLLKLGQGRWALYTVTFEDNVAISDFEDGILVRVYFNDTLYHTARIKSALRLNNGNLYLLPADSNNGQEPIKNARIGDLAYYNYAVGAQQTRETYLRGPPRYMSKDILRGNSMLGDPLYLSEYNRLDVYNT